MQVVYNISRTVPASPLTQSVGVNVDLPHMYASPYILYQQD